MATTPTTVDIHGYALRVIRQLTGLSAQALAEQVGVTDAYVRMIENGRSKRVSATIYRAILDALALTDHRVLLANPHGDQSVVVAGAVA
jgi:transcriptional regulator with XRE-family HTH domain